MKKAPGRIGVFLHFILAALSPLLVGGCSILDDYGALIRGNRLHARGSYEEAAASYLSAREGAFGPVLDYDLANVYARLGEFEAAEELYEKVRKSADPSLSAAAYYNEGIALHEKNRYGEAYRAFRAALALDPADEPARRNLEIAYRDWKKSSLAPPERATPSSRTQGKGDDELNLFRRLETGNFRPGSSIPPEPNPEDF